MFESVVFNGSMSAFQAVRSGFKSLRTLQFVALALLTGCDTIHCRTDAPDVHIAPECLSACNLEAPLISGDPDSLVDAAATERAYLKQCDIKRRLCVAALIRAQDAKAIK